MSDFTPYSYTQPRFMPGVEIVVSKHALEETGERLFPASKHRSARIRKKLLKRFGGEFRKVPCVWRYHDKIVMHPSLYADFQKQMSERVNTHFEKAILGAIA